MKEFKDRVGLIKDQPEEYQRGYYDGYHNGYSDMQSRVNAVRKEERNRFEEKLAHIEYSSLYPFNLLEDIVDDIDDEGEAKMRLYSAETLNRLITERLTERERRVLELRYRDNKTLQEVGDIFSFTRERTRQIELKAFWKLRRQIHEAAVVPAGEYDALNRECDRMKAEIESYKNKCCSEKTDSEKQAVSESLHKKKHHLDNVMLSVRSYNRLRRAGFTYLEDLQGVPYYDLMAIPGLGYKSFCEIYDRMLEFGLEPPSIPQTVLARGNI